MIRTISALLIILSLSSFILSYGETESKSQNTDASSESEGRQENKPAENSTNGAPGEIVVIEINGTINPATFDYIRVSLEEAEAKSAEALIILLDTPGGLLTSTKEIVKLILNSPTPVVVYVSPKGASATSAGVFITLSANIAAMAPGTSIGAAHPVSLTPGGKKPEEKDKDIEKDSNQDLAKDSKEGEGKDGAEEPEGTGKSNQDVMNEKIENYASSFIESIAEERGRNVEWAIEAVRKSSSITSTEALEIKVIDLIAPNLTELIDDIDGWEVKLPKGERTLNTRGASISRIEMSAKQKLIDVLSTPDIAFLLLSLGSLGLLLEFYNPGLIFPGVAGVVCLLMGFVSFQILPFNYAGIVLLLLGIGLFVTEVYITSYGLLSLGGIISFGLGALLLFDTPESDLRVGFDVVIASTLAFALFFGYVVFYLIKAQKLQPKLGYEGLIGEEGDAISDIADTGKAFVQGEYWDAESDEPIAKGDRVIVVEFLKGFKLKVKKLDN
ncbi:MAG: nodulation protein NfeD [Deltaproteobacteria bacterium]